MSDAEPDRYLAQLAEARAQIAALRENNLLDEDGYPTESALAIIRLWPCDDDLGWFNFIESLWHHRDWGWSMSLSSDSDDLFRGKPVYHYRISTGGWSGNESIIRAMEQNRLLWDFSWVQSRRGGHYIFERKEGNENS